MPKARVRLETRDAFAAAPLGEYDVIAVTGSLPVYDARFERALRVGGRLFAVVGSAPVMEAILVRRVGRCRMDSRKPVRDRHRPVDQRDRRAEVRVLMVEELTPRQFLERRAQGAHMTLLDVREDWEIDLAPVPSPTVHIPMGQIAERLGELDPNAATVVICRSGGRSAEVARSLEGRGFANGVQSRRRHPGLVPGYRSEDPAVLARCTSRLRRLGDIVIYNTS